MRVIQFQSSHGRSLGVVQGDRVRDITLHNPSLNGTYAAFLAARRSGRRLDDLLNALMGQDRDAELLDYNELLTKGRVLPPVIEEPGTRLLISGTGLTHLGSVQQRDAMHRQTEVAGPKTDSQKMLEIGMAGGRPAPGSRGSAPEWFYKGDGRILRGPGQALEVPPFAPDGGEEPEVAAIYAVDDAGVPCRLGFMQGNEWSDHATEKLNYLYLAPSKLRVCAIGPELVTDLEFQDVRGRCRVLRSDRMIYDSGELLTGQRNMCHSLANVEDHHFKFPQHRLPGDLHVHFLGTSKLSYPQRDWHYQTGDLVEVSFEGLGASLRNPIIRQEPSATPIVVEQA
jgi:hypothetical protein